METGKELLSNEKRAAKAKLVRVCFTASDYFNVVDEMGNLKYVGRVRGPLPDLEDSCSCPDFTNRNNQAYMDEHGFALQCKHILKARSIRYADYPAVQCKGCQTGQHCYGTIPGCHGKCCG